MALVTLAGCLAAPSADPAARLAADGLSRDLGLAVARERVELAATHDGARLVADVFRPEIPERVPVVLVVSPYFGSQKGGDGLPRTDIADWLVATLAPRGYAVAFADLRGTGGSEGCMDFGGPAERADVVDWVEVLAAAEWSSGRVAMTGHSYDGFVALMAAAEAPPALVAVAPVAPVSDWYRVVAMGGAKYAFWVPQVAAAYSFQIGFAARDPALLADRVARPDCYLSNQVGSDEPSGDRTPYLAERDLNRMAANATAALFYTHGFLDVNAKPDNAVPWLASYGGAKRAWLWQAPHVWPFADETGRGDAWLRELHRFLDHHLLGLANGADAEAHVVEVQDNLGRWRNESAFPPADARAFTLHADAAGALAEAPPGEEAALVFLTDGRETGGLLPTLDTLPDAGAGRALAWESAPLARDVHLSGEPVARFRASFDRPAGVLVAYLHDCDGARCRLVDRGALNARHRDGVERPAEVPAGETLDLSVRMYPRDWVFAAGHTMRLTVTGGDHAWLIPTGGVGETRVVVGPDGVTLTLPEDPGVAPWLEAWGKLQGAYAPV